jgi:mono/diheme cytochrome c family protein
MNLNVRRPALVGVVLLLLTPFAFELTATRATPPQRRQSIERSRDGQKVLDLYRNNCARCHGGDGRGDTPLGHTYNAPDFTDPEWWQKHSKITNTASLITLVSRGKGGMPAFGKKLSRTEINRLVAYVRRFKNQTPTNH